MQTHRFGGGQSCAGTGEWIIDNPDAERESRPHKFPHEPLRLQGWMRSDFPFGPACGRTSDDVFERFILGDSPQSARAPGAQVFGYGPREGFTENTPRLPAGPRHHRDVRKLVLRALGPVTAPERLH